MKHAMTVASAMIVMVVIAMTSSQAEAFTVDVVSSNNNNNNGVLSTTEARRTSPLSHAVVLKMSDGWSDFGSLDDDDDDLYEEDLLLNDGVAIDRTEYATENDSPEIKQQVGASLEPPSIEDGIEGGSQDIEPLFVQPGSQLELDELTVVRVLQACRDEIGTVFGYAVDNRAVGITGGVDYVGLDGPSVIIRLKGRFWHQRTTVLDRVANYLQQRIPEIIDVSVEDEWQLTDEANEVF